MTNQQIRTALLNVINTFAQTKAIPLAKENILFQVPSTTTLYLRATLLPSRDINTTQCYNTEIKRGVFQIDIVSPTDTGTLIVANLIEEIKALYPQGQRIGGVRITQPIGETGGVAEKDRFFTTLSIYYSSI